MNSSARFSSPAAGCVVLAALCLLPQCASSAGSDAAAAADAADALAFAQADAKASSDVAADAAAAEVQLTDAGPGDVASAGDVATATPTFHKDIEPILQAKCQGCHSGSGIAPFALMTWADTKLRASSALAAMKAGSMPPWGARETAECKPRFGWQHDLRALPEEMATLAAWISAGMPEGDPADAPKAAGAPTLELANIDATVQPAKGFVASGDSDQMRCFVIDPGITTKKWLNGIQILPGNPTVVHHALVFQDPTNESAKLANADGQYDCFGGVGVSGKLIEAWAPGAVPLEFPSNVGTPILPGTRFVMQIHYHPAGAVNAKIDLTRVVLRFTQGEPEWTGASVLIGNFDKPLGPDLGLLPGEDDPAGGPEFVIPAGKAAHRESMRFLLPATLNGAPMPELHIYGVGTHMHYLGHDMKVWLDRAFAAPPCTQGQLDPMLACTAANCPGASGGDLITCATKICAKEAAALQGACGDCIKAGVLAGSAVSDIVAKCKQQQPKPANITDPDSECLVETPAWDFDWQRIYNYNVPIAELPKFRAGDALNLRCTYDNTLANPAVKAALAQEGLSAPVAVKLGETTLDEMCLAILQVVFKVAK